MASEQMTFTLGIKTQADLTGIKNLENSFKELQRSINDKDSIVNNIASPAEVNKASMALNSLNKIIHSSFDANLNGINFNTFQKEIKKSGLSLSDMQRQLSMLGADGQTVFARMTTEVFKMNNAVKLGNGLTEKLWNTFKSTLTYTGFNMLINNISGTISKAVSYVEDLDTSLNNIRIVSGQSADSMKEFAVQANKAAQALGANTIAYTDAALIYYQQGLEGEEVTQRTDVTTKMANVTGESAQQVSEDLTAIWNNFYDGSKSLEYYADVLTALGASTASSTSEIAEGLEKFAAIGDTVGLSYEYATSALATVVAETRQSADTVGTAFKTIFARLQGLQLGETLEDGTSLNKYSEALNAVGISIKSSNGELKAMDEILDELGSKWESLNKDQQVALAQTVAGTRQYAQLVALMDNWETFSDNLNTATNATGELNKQQNIYMESTTAHIKELAATSEKLYNDLFKSDDIIFWVDAIQDGVKLIDDMVVAFGGLKNIIPIIGTMLVKAFSSKIAASITNFGSNIVNKNIQDQEDYSKEQYLAQYRDKIGQNSDISMSLSGQQLQEQVNFASEMYKYRSQMNKVETENLNTLQAQGAELISQTAQMEEQKNTYLSRSNEAKLFDTSKDNYFGASGMDTTNLNNGIETLSKALTDLQTKTEGCSEDTEQLSSVTSKWLNDYQVELKESGIDIDELRKKFNEYKNEEDGSFDSVSLEKFIDKIKTAINEANDLSGTINDVAIKTEQAKKAMENFKNTFSMRSIIDGTVKTVNGLGQMATAISMMPKMIDIWSNDDITTGEKVIQTIMNLSMTIGMITSSAKSLNDGISAVMAFFQTRMEATQAALALQLAEQESAKAAEIASVAEKNADINAIEEAALAYRTSLREREIAEVRHAAAEKAKIEAENAISNNTSGTTTIAANMALEKSIEELTVADMELAKANIKVGETYAAVNAIKGEAILTDKGEIITKTADITATEGESIVTAEDTLITNANTTAQNTNTDAINTNTGALDTNTVAEGGNAEATSSNTAVKGANTLAQGRKGASKDIKEISKLFGKSGGAAGGAMGTISGVITAIAAAAITAAATIAAFAAIYSVLDDNMKATTASYKEQAAEMNKQRIAAQEEADNIHELSDEYKDLVTQKENGNISDEELRKSTYRLCLQYGQESLAIRALTADYEDLNNIIEEAEKKQLSTVANKASQESELTRRGMESQIDSKWNLFEDASVVNTDLVTFQGEKEYAQAIAKSLGLSEDAFKNENGGYTFDISNYIDEIAENREAFEQAMSAYGGTGGDFESELEKIYNDDFKSSLTSYQEAKTAEEESNMKIALLNFNKNVETYEEYEKEKEELFNEVRDYFESDDEAYEWINSQLSDSSFSDKILDFNIADNLASSMLGREATREQLSEMSAEIASWTESQQAYAKAHPATFANLNIEEAKAKLEEYSDIIDDWTTLNNQRKISFAISMYTEEDGFTQEVIDNLFSDEDFTLKINGIIEVDKEEFEKLDQYSQFNLLGLQKINSYDSLNAENNQKELETLEAERDRYTNSDGKQDGLKRYLIDQGVLQEGTYLADLDTTWDDNYLQNNYEIQLDNFNALGVSIETVNELLNEERDLITQVGKASEDGTLNFGELNTEQINEYIAKMQEAGYEIQQAGDGAYVIDTDSIDDFNTYVEAVKRYDNAQYWKDLSEQAEMYELRIQEIESDIENYNGELFSEEELEDSIQNLDSISKSFDNLQNAYKSLTDITEDFNEDGKISIDNLQTLLALEPKYLACLEQQGDKLVFNEEALIQLAKNRIEEAKASVYQQGIIRIGLVLQENEQLMSEELALDKIREAEANNILIGTTDQLCAAFYREIQARNGLKNSQRVAIDEIRRDVETEIKALENVDFSTLYTSKSSGSSKKKDKKEKDFNDEFDRYWDINKALDKIADSMQRLDKIQSKLHGKELIRSLQHENELLAIQTEKYKELAAEQNKELSEINEKLGAVGFTFDDNGEMTNYIAQSKQMIADFNQVTADYNAGKIDDDSYEKMSNEYEAIKKLVDRYDALIKERRDTQNNIDDNARKELENNLQAWEVNLELRLDTKEAERDWNDFIEKINTDFKSVYTDFTSLFRSDVFNANSLNSSIGIDINAVKQVETEIDKMLAGGKSSMFESISEAQEKLKELRDTLKDDAETLFDLYQEGWENYLKAIDEVISKMDEIVKRYEQIDSHLSHEEKMIELIYGDKAYDKKAKLYETQQKSLESQMKSYKQQIQFYNEQLAKEDPSSEAAKKWREQIREAENALQQAEESYMETSINAYQNKVDAKFNPILEQAQQDKEEWEKQQALNDLYENDEERLNDLAILQAKWNKLVNNVKGLDTQKKLKNLMEAEMADLEDRNELTQYDIDLMEKKMAVAQAMADMEDAQNNKNTMKVTRGEDGNWSYQYVADDSQVEEKQLAYLQAIRDQYELTQSHIREVNEEMLDNQITAITEMKDLYYQGYYNMEETSIKAQELSAYYWGEDGLITEQLSIGQQGIRDFNISTLELVSETCESQLIEQTAWSEEIIKLNETIIDSNLNNWTTCEEASIAYFDAVDAGYITLDGKLTDAAVKAGVTLTSIFGNVQGFAINVKDTNIGIESDIETLLSNVVDNFDDMFNSVHTTFGLIEDANEISLTNMINLWNGDDDSSFKGQIEEAITECDGYIADFWNDIADGCAAAGEDFTDIISSLEDIQYEIEETDYMTQDAVDNAADALDEYREYLEEVRRAWEEAKEAIEEATDALQYYLSLEGKDPGNHNYSGSNSGGASGGSTGIGSGGKAPSNKNGNNTISGINSYGKLYHLLYGDMEYSNSTSRYSLEQTINANQGKGPHGETWGNWEISESPGSRDYEEKHYYSRDNQASGERETNVFWEAKNAHDQYPYQQYVITKMDTGGYTGEWNNGNEDGKLAVLHQKELVLNSDDTKNILNAVDMVRQLSSLSIEQMIANAIAGALKGLSDIGNVSNVSNTNSSNTNNNISIYADFPNANDVNEIKEALLSLPNLANQYISRQMK